MIQDLELLQYLQKSADLGRSKEDIYLIARWIGYYISHRADRLFSVVHPFYTLHNHEHMEAVLKHLFTICERLGLLEPQNQHVLSATEVFYLICSAYLHDIGMIMSDSNDENLARQKNVPVGEIIREDHHNRSQIFVEKNKKYFALEDIDVEIIGLLCVGHRLNSLENDARFDNRAEASGKPIRVRLLASLLQVADELDMSYRRAPSFELFNIMGLQQFSPISKLHWMKHYYTESVSFRLEERNDRSKSLLIDITLSVPDDSHQRYLEKEIRERLNRHLESLKNNFNKYGFDIEFGRFIIKGNSNKMKSLVYKNQIHTIIIHEDEWFAKQMATQLQGLGFKTANIIAPTDLPSVLAFDNLAQPHIVICQLGFESRPDGGIALIDAMKNHGWRSSYFILLEDDNTSQVSQKSARVVQSGINPISIYKPIEELAQEIGEIVKTNLILVEDPTKQGETIMSVQVYSFDPYHILLVDNDEDFLDILKEEIEEIAKSNNVNIEIDFASGNPEAREMLAQKRYHAMTIDREMNKFNGVFDGDAGTELLEFVIKKYPDTSCLILTKSPELDNYKKVIHWKGLFDYLDKKTTPNQDIAHKLFEMFEARRDILHSQSMMAVKADRMFFYRKKGIIVKTVTDKTDQNAGIVEIDGEKWRATTLKSGAYNNTIAVGQEVFATGIIHGCLQVVSQLY